ncbi:MAG: MATE family efflux transporter [Planctomycetes bacterium]|nr:MATE family efflux transporter [Planctomycetota bacterium]MBL7007380.1 MATE family efflux transporter [Planctomycetota bacterium]
MSALTLRTRQETPLREALRLSWPATLSLLLHSGYRVNDQYWVQFLGPDAQASLGITAFMLILNFAFIQLVHAGTLARVAQHTGAGDHQGVEDALRAALKVGMVWIALVALAGWLTSGIWVRFLGASGQVEVWSKVYLERIYVCLPLIALKPISDGIFIGLGNTMVPMILSALTVALNFFLNPLLIYGAGGWDGMGIAGAAWATGFSRGLGGLLGLVLLRRLYGLRPRLRQKVPWAEVRRLFAIGAPMAMSTAAYSLAFILVLKTSVEPFGRTVQAGLGAAFNGVEAIAYCGLLGPAIAVSGMVGRHVGAKRFAAAQAAVRACVALSVGISLVFTLVFLLAPERLARVFSEDPAVQAQAVLYLMVAAWSQSATAVNSVLDQALVGAGRTGAMALISATGYALRIPLAFVLAHVLAFGPAGVWWSLNASNYLKLLAIIPLYRWQMRRLSAA